MSFDPLTRLMYIPVIDMSNVLYDMESGKDENKYINGNFTVGQPYMDDSYDSGGTDSTLPQ